MDERGRIGECERAWLAVESTVESVLMCRVKRGATVLDEERVREGPLGCGDRSLSGG